MALSPRFPVESTERRGSCRQSVPILPIVPTDRTWGRSRSDTCRNRFPHSPRRRAPPVCSIPLKGLMQPDDEVCLCFHVTRRKIENYIRIHRPSRPSQLSQCGGAGTGCGWCVPFLRRYFENARPQPGQAAPADITSEQYASQRAAYIQRGKVHDANPGTSASPPPSYERGDSAAGDAPPPDLPSR